MMLQVSNTLKDYLVCALWTNEMDNRSIFDFTKASVVKADKDLEKFIDENTNDCLKVGFGKIGHNFWLSRNGHGSGFFDLPDSSATRELEEACERLQDAARKFREVDVTKWKGRLYLEP